MKKRRKRALITGITGQDGSYLADYLLSLGYEVWGLVRRTSLDPLMRLERAAPNPRTHLVYGNLRDSASIARALTEAQPDEIYNLAAQSDVGISFKCPEETFEINYFGLGRLIQEVQHICPKARIYQASTSEMFGATKPPQNEQSSLAPVSPYGESKTKAHQDFVVAYRERYGMFICSGILFNHESPRRGEHFVTRKVTISLSKIKLGMQKSFVLGNLEAKRDWGFAGDYIRAMHLMLQEKKPDDYVIATGIAHSVREFVEEAARSLDMKITWKGSGLDEIGVDAAGNTIITVDKKFYRPHEVNALRGDPSKAAKKLGWKPQVKFEQLVQMMTKSDFERLQKNR